MPTIPEAGRSFFASRPKQREVAVRLDEAFDITYGDMHAELSFWPAGPRPHTRERFGLNQEVLVIYSSHSTTDARVLRAIDAIGRMQAFKHRMKRFSA